MSRRSLRGVASAALPLLLGSAGAGVARAESTAANIADFRTRVEKWVETRQIISREQADWEAERETLRASRELLAQEKESLHVPRQATAAQPQPVAKGKSVGLGELGLQGKNRRQKTIKPEKPKNMKRKRKDATMPCHKGNRPPHNLSIFHSRGLLLFDSGYIPSASINRLAASAPEYCCCPVIRLPSRTAKGLNSPPLM